MTRARIGALILAAGFSSRMGRFKPLLPMGGRPVAVRVVEAFWRGGVSDAVVLTGHGFELLEPVLAELPVERVHNPEPERGMFSSIRLGVEKLPPAVEAFFVHPVDVPLIRPETIRTLIEAWGRTPGGVHHPVFDGRVGHPPLLPFPLGEAIIDQPPDGTLRHVLYESDAPHHFVPVADQGVLWDMDHPEDYQRLLARFENWDVPTAEEIQALFRRHPPLKDGVVDHGRAVARAATVMAQAIGWTDRRDLDLLDAAGRLHDLAKGHPDHDLTGSGWLAEAGFHRLAEVTAAHKDLPVIDHESIDHRQLIYLADKTVQGTRLVRPEDRFQRAMGRHGHDPDARRAIETRMANADRVRAKVERAAGRSLIDIFAAAGLGPGADLA